MITTTAAPGREYYKEEVESDIKKGTFLTTENSKWMILKNEKLLLCSLTFMASSNHTNLLVIKAIMNVISFSHWIQNLWLT